MAYFNGHRISGSVNVAMIGSNIDTSTVANAVKGYATGASLEINDLSPLTTSLKVLPTIKPAEPSRSFMMMRSASPASTELVNLLPWPYYNLDVGKEYTKSNVTYRVNDDGTIFLQTEPGVTASANVFVTLYINSTGLNKFKKGNKYRVYTTGVSEAHVRFFISYRNDDGSSGNDTIRSYDAPSLLKTILISENSYGWSASVFVSKGADLSEGITLCPMVVLDNGSEIKEYVSPSGASQHIHDCDLITHVCKICGAVTDCIDPDGDGKCDICGEAVEHEHVRDPYEHTCIHCGAIIDACKDDDPRDHFCDICGEPYESEAHKDTNNDHLCDYCDAVMSECERESGTHECKICGKTMDTCSDPDGDGKCDICGKSMNTGEHVCERTQGTHVCKTCGKVIDACLDGDNNHYCDICNAKISVCVDRNPKNHYCDICGAKMTDCEDRNKDHLCDTCNKIISYCVDADKDHNCDICGAKLSECEDPDGDHVCDYCGQLMADHATVTIKTSPDENFDTVTQSITTIPGTTVDLTPIFPRMFITTDREDIVLSVEYAKDTNVIVENLREEIQENVGMTEDDKVEIKEYVDSAVADVDLTNYAPLVDGVVPDTHLPDYADKDYVDTAIANIEIPEAGSDVEIVQTTGDSENAVMSQDAVTTAIEDSKEVYNITSIDTMYSSVEELPLDVGNGTCYVVANSTDRALYAFDATESKWNKKSDLKAHTIYAVLTGDKAGLYRYTMSAPYLVSVESHTLQEAKEYAHSLVENVGSGVYDLVITSDEEFSKCLYAMEAGSANADFKYKTVLVKDVTFKFQRGSSDLDLQIFQPSIKYIKFENCRWETEWWVSGKVPTTIAANNTQYTRAPGDFDLVIDGIEVSADNVQAAKDTGVYWYIGLRNIKALINSTVRYPEDYDISNNWNFKLTCQYFDYASNNRVTSLWDGANVSDCYITEKLVRCNGCVNIVSYPVMNDGIQVSIVVQSCNNLSNFIGKFSYSGCNSVDCDTCDGWEGPSTQYKAYDYIINKQADLLEILSTKTLVGRRILLRDFTINTTEPLDFKWAGYVGFSNMLFGADVTFSNIWSIDGSGLDASDNKYTVTVKGGERARVCNFGRLPISATESKYTYSQCRSVTNCIIGEASECVSIRGCYISKNEDVLISKTTDISGLTVTPSRRTANITLSNCKNISHVSNKGSGAIIYDNCTNVDYFTCDGSDNPLTAILERLSALENNT
jgi:hypothetical protein